MAKPRFMLILLRLRLQGERCHHGHDVQEDYDVANKRLRDLLAENDLDVRPQELVRQPEENAERHQAPEQTSAPVILPDVREQGGSSRQKEYALRDVAKNIER